MEIETDCEVFVVKVARLVLAVVLLSCSPALLAQTSNGTVAGTVVDKTGAAISGALVTAHGLQTGELRTAITNSSGGYRIESLLPGTFAVTVEANGFSLVTVDEVVVNASIVTSIQVTLRAGAVQSVQVSGSNKTLETDSGAISGTLSTEAVDNLPIQGLNPYFLAETLPGVSVITSGVDDTNGIGFSVNGSRARANNFLIEGTDNNDAGIHGQGLQPSNLDAIKEVIVLESANQAEFGHGGGSVNNLIFKDGSNTFHGAVWDRVLNSSLDASDKSNFFSGQTKSKYRENVFGFDVGGFILRNKLFFFVSTQWDHYRSSSQSTLIVPTASGIATLKSLPQNTRINNLLTAISTLQGQDFTSTQIAAGVSGSSNFACLSISESTAATAYCGASQVAAGPAQRSIPALTNSPEFDSKGEWLASPRDVLTIRYIRTAFNAPYDTSNFPSQLPGFDTTQTAASHNAGVLETHIFSPSLINEIRLSYGRIGDIFDFQKATYANQLALGPTYSIPGLAYYGAPSGDPQGRFHNTYQLQDALSWNHGKHFAKVGFDIFQVRIRDTVPFNSYGSVSYASSTGISGLGNYIDDFGGGTTSTGGTVSQSFGSPIVHTSMLSQNYYVQDTWKLFPSLTIEGGLRYEYAGTPFNNIAYPAFDVSNPTCTKGFCTIRQIGDHADFSPRLGFSYSPTFWKAVLGKNKTVIRGAAGVFYDGLFTNIVDNTASSAPNAASPQLISTSTTASPRGIANFSKQLSTLNHTPQMHDFEESMAPHILSPETIQWNINVQRELPGSFVAQIAYVGTRGEHLYATSEMNPTNAFSGLRLYPGRGRILQRDNSGDSVYHSGQAELNRTFHHGFLIRAAYTFSRFEDDTSEIFTTSQSNSSQFALAQYPNSRKKYDWSLSSLDVRHRFVLSYVYQVPAWHTSGLRRIPAIAVNGWQISGITQFQSGSPANVEVGYDVNGDGITNDRPILSNPRAPLQSYAFDATNVAGPAGVYVDGPSLWYQGAVNIVDGSSVHWLVGEYGSNANEISRNSFLTRGYQQWDFTLQRSFAIRKKQALDFRGEFFNVFNHGNTGDPLLTLTSINPNPTLYGANNFGLFGPTVYGHRNARFYLKYSF